MSATRTKSSNAGAAPPPRFTAWSYSRLADYEACPAKAKYKHIDKLKEPDSPVLARGTAIHKEAEQYSTGLISKLPESLARFAKEFAALRKVQKLLNTESQIALTKDWKIGDWFGHEAWCRVVIDCWYLSDGDAIVIDYKTGKVREESLEQLGLYALAMFATHSSVDTVVASLWYLDSGDILTETFARADKSKLERQWVKRSLPLLKDQKFKPTPGNACRWCHYSKAKVGPCAF